MRRLATITDHAAKRFIERFILTDDDNARTILHRWFVSARQCTTHEATLILQKCPASRHKSNIHPVGVITKSKLWVNQDEKCVFVTQLGLPGEYVLITVFKLDIVKLCIPALPKTEWFSSGDLANILYGLELGNKPKKATIKKLIRQSHELLKMSQSERREGT